jgi:hypothetical protein
MIVVSCGRDRSLMNGGDDAVGLPASSGRSYWRIWLLNFSSHNDAANHSTGVVVLFESILLPQQSQ